MPYSRVKEIKMKLKIVVSGETFDVENRLGRALLTIGEGKIQEVLPPPPPPQDLSVKWSSFGSSGSTALPGLRVECGRCHQGLTMHNVVEFRHCRTQVDLPPQEMADALRAVLKARKPVKRDPSQPMDQSAVRFIESF
jgi:hypothetical protein